MSLEHINSIENISNEFTVVDFFATWCGPCRMLGPVLEELSESYIIKKLDVDENENEAMKYNVNTIPTIILFKEKKEIARRIGFASKNDLEQWFNENK